MKRNRTVAHRVRQAHTPTVTMHPQPEHIPATMRLERRPTRDDREDERMQLRTADGHVVALVERVDPESYCGPN